MFNVIRCAPLPVDSRNATGNPEFEIGELLFALFSCPPSEDGRGQLGGTRPHRAAYCPAGSDAGSWRKLEIGRRYISARRAPVSCDITATKPSASSCSSFPMIRAHRRARARTGTAGVAAARGNARHGSSRHRRRGSQRVSAVDVRVLQRPGHAARTAVETETQGADREHCCQPRAIPVFRPTCVRLRSAELPLLPAIMEANCCHNLSIEAFAKLKAAAVSCRSSGSFVSTSEPRPAGGCWIGAWNARRTCSPQRT